MGLYNLPLSLVIAFTSWVVAWHLLMRDGKNDRTSSYLIIALSTLSFVDVLLWYEQAQETDDGDDCTWLNKFSTSGLIPLFTAAILYVSNAQSPVPRGTHWSMFVAATAIANWFWFSGCCSVVTSYTLNGVTNEDFVYGGEGVDVEIEDFTQLAAMSWGGRLFSPMLAMALYVAFSRPRSMLDNSTWVREYWMMTMIVGMWAAVSPSFIHSFWLVLTVSSWIRALHNSNSNNSNNSQSDSNGGVEVIESNVRGGVRGRVRTSAHASTRRPQQTRRRVIRKRTVLRRGRNGMTEPVIVEEEVVGVVNEPEQVSTFEKVKDKVKSWLGIENNDSTDQQLNEEVVIVQEEVEPSTTTTTASGVTDEHHNNNNNHLIGGDASTHTPASAASHQVEVGPYMCTFPSENVARGLRARNKVVSRRKGREVVPNFFPVLCYRLPKKEELSADVVAEIDRVHAELGVFEADASIGNNGRLDALDEVIDNTSLLPIEVLEPAVIQEVITSDGEVEQVVVIPNEVVGFDSGAGLSAETNQVVDVIPSSEIVPPKDVLAPIVVEPKEVLVVPTVDPITGVVTSSVVEEAVVKQANGELLETVRVTTERPSHACYTTQTIDGQTRSVKKFSRALPLNQQQKHYYGQQQQQQKSAFGGNKTKHVITRRIGRSQPQQKYLLPQKTKTSVWERGMGRIRSMWK